MPTQSEKILESLYSENWEKPDPDYVPFVMDNSIVDGLGARFYRYHHFIKSWQSGQINKTLSLLNTMLELYPADHLLQYCKQSINIKIIESNTLSNIKSSDIQ